MKYKTFAIIKSLISVIGLITIIYNPAHAELADKDKPLNFESNNASYDDTKQIYNLNGNVIITKGTIVLKTNSAVIKVNPDGYQQATAAGGGSSSGGLAYIRQKREGLNEFFEGYGEKLEYNSQLDNIKLIGNAKILRLDANNKIIDQIKAPQMLYNGRNETYQAIGDSSTGGRVRATIAPKTGN
ncbi:MAG: lipopolysaccharide export system protein LptA [Pseudomonadota bacterium]|jgi:lipopolysaccharide export system protein LptA